MGRTATIDIETAATRANVTPRTVWNWITVGLGDGIRLKAEKNGGKWTIRPADLADFRRRLTDAALSRATS